jgi:hypothetical protein
MRTKREIGTRPVCVFVGARNCCRQGPYSGTNSKSTTAKTGPECYKSHLLYPLGPRGQKSQLDRSQCSKQYQPVRCHCFGYNVSWCSRGWNAKRRIHLNRYLPHRLHWLRDDNAFQITPNLHGERYYFAASGGGVEDSSSDGYGPFCMSSSRAAGGQEPL